MLSGRPRPAPSQRPPRRLLVLARPRLDRPPSRGGASRLLRWGATWGQAVPARRWLSVWPNSGRNCAVAHPEALTAAGLAATSKPGAGRGVGASLPPCTGLCPFVRRSWLCLSWFPRHLCSSRQPSQRRTTTSSLCKDAGAWPLTFVTFITQLYSEIENKSKY